MRSLLVISLSAICAMLQAGEPAPRKELAAMQGRWQLDGKKSVLVSVPKNVTETFPGKLTDALAAIRIDENRLYFGSVKEPASVATNVQVEGLRASAEGFQLLCVTFPDGRALLGSYKVGPEDLEIRFPHTCICSRSGIMAKFVRNGK